MFTGRTGLCCISGYWTAWCTCLWCKPFERYDTK